MRLRVRCALCTRFEASPFALPYLPAALILPHTAYIRTADDATASEYERSLLIDTRRDKVHVQILKQTTVQPLLNVVF